MNTWPHRLLGDDVLRQTGKVKGLYQVGGVEDVGC